MDQVLVPIVLFILVFSIPIIAIISDGRSKRSRDRVVEKALEAGIGLEEVKSLFPEAADRAEARRTPYRKGLIVLGIGAALLLVRYLIGPDRGMEGSTEFSDQFGGMLIGGTICAFIGIAMVLGDFLNRGERRSGD